MRVLVTGAAGGIGSATAKQLEQLGHTVVRHDARDAPGMDLVGDLTDPHTLERIYLTCDAVGVDAVAATHGRSGAGRVIEADPASVRDVVRVNTTSVFALYESVGGLIAGRGGAFTVVSSQSGLDGEAENGFYCASKFALLGWARAAAVLDGSPRLRVVCPGMVDTALLRAGLDGMARAAGETFEDLLERRLSTIPSGRLGRPEEIGRAIVWLLELRTPACVVAAVTGGETFD